MTKTVFAAANLVGGAMWVGLYYMVKVLVLAIATLALYACGPSMVVLHDPASGKMAQCQADPWANWNVYAATEACAKGYEAAGYQRTGSY